MTEYQDRALALYAAGMRDREPVRDADLMDLSDTFVIRHDTRTLAPVFEELQWLRNEIARLEDEIAYTKAELEREGTS